MLVRQFLALTQRDLVLSYFAEGIAFMTLRITASPLGKKPLTSDHPEQVQSEAQVRILQEALPRTACHQKCLLAAQRLPSHSNPLR
jgi:hypothetical protein